MTTIPEDVIERAARAIRDNYGELPYKYIWFHRDSEAALTAAGYPALLDENKRLKEEVERLRAELAAKEAP